VREKGVEGRKKMGKQKPSLGILLNVLVIHEFVLLPQATVTRRINGKIIEPISFSVHFCLLVVIALIVFYTTYTYRFAHSALIKY
jgi:hypothetical protein